MKLQEARNRIEEVFAQSFKRDSFVRLMKDIFQEQMEEKNKIITGNYIKDKFKPYVRKYEQVAKYYDGENTIDILIVELHKGNSVERARHSQRNFIAEYLKNKDYREAALAAFYSEDLADWRFSLITLQYSLHDKKDQLSSAKRYSFLVGENERSHTAQRQRTYFDNQLNNIDEIRNKIEQILVSSIPYDAQMKTYYKLRFETCWDYADDEIFAGESGVQNHEIAMRNRFIRNVVEKIRNS